MAMANAGSAHHRGNLQPPHISYRRFREVLDQIGANPLPKQLNPKDWGAPSQGADRVTNALQFFGFVAEDLAPGWQLRQFSRASSGERREIIRQAVLARFGWISALAPGTTQDEFRSILASHCSLTREPLTRAAVFIVSAARDLKIDIPVIPSRPGPRSKSPPEPLSLVHAALQPELSRSIANYSAFLLEEARRSARRGEPDRDLLDRLERLTLAILESGRSTPG